jgi:hypothetical protein
MTFVLGVVDRFEEFGISSGVADVLWRAASCNVDQARIKNTVPLAGFLKRISWRLKKHQTPLRLRRSGACASP